MRRALQRSARERFTLRYVLGLVAFFAVMRYVVGVTTEGIQTMLVGLVVVETVHVVNETPTVAQRTTKAGVGALVALGSVGLAALTVYGDGEMALWFPVLTFLAGCWFLADAAADHHLRVDGTENAPDLDSNEILLRMNHAHLVAEALRDGPRTVPELADDIDLTESRVEDAVGSMTDSGVATRNGDQYVLAESELGAVAFARALVVRALSPLLRPARVLLAT